MQLTVNGVRIMFRAIESFEVRDEPDAVFLAVRTVSGVEHCQKVPSQEAGEALIERLLERISVCDSL